MIWENILNHVPIYKRTRESSKIQFQYSSQEYHLDSGKTLSDCLLQYFLVFLYLIFSNQFSVDKCWNIRHLYLSCFVETIVTNYPRMNFKKFIALLGAARTECIDFFANQKNDVFNPSQAKSYLGQRNFSLLGDWQLTAIFRFHGHFHKDWQPHWSMLLHSMSFKYGKCGDRIPAIWFYHSKNKEENRLHVASCVSPKGSVS